MRIEVVVDQNEPQVYPLNQPKIMIGASESCDIVLSVDGVSRKHLLVINEEDDFYVIDQGSTNGTFINEERLVPGKRSPFTSFFPVRLGENVLLTLLSEDESRGANLKSLNTSKSDASSPSLGNPIKTDPSRILTRTDLQRKSLSTGASSKKTSKGNSKINAKKSSDDKQMKLVTLLAVLIVGIAAYYNLNPENEYNDQIVETDARAPDVPSEIANPVSAEGPMIEKEPILISEAEITSREELNTLLTDFKCLSENEKILCDAIPAASVTGWGVTQVGTSLNIMIDGAPFLKAAQDILPPLMENTPPPANYIQERNLLMSALFLKDGIVGELSDERLKGYKLNFGLFLETENGRKVEVAFAGYPKSVMEAKPLVTDDIINTIRQAGVQHRLDKLKDYIRLY